MLLHNNMPVPQSIDFTLYRNDPMAPMVLFAPEKYSSQEVAWSVSAEGDVLEQHLKDFDVSGGLKDQAAYAVALMAEQLGQLEHSCGADDRRREQERETHGVLV